MLNRLDEFAARRLPSAQDPRWYRWLRAVIVLAVLAVVVSIINALTPGENPARLVVQYVLVAVVLLVNSAYWLVRRNARRHA